MKTIKQYAEEQGVSYEAIRKQISTYKEELKDHIILTKKLFSGCTGKRKSSRKNKVAQA